MPEKEGNQESKKELIGCRLWRSTYWEWSIL